MELEHVTMAMLHPKRAVVALPREQFEAARVLRGEHWSHYRIACALGISPSQVHVAVGHDAHDRWAA